MGSVMTAFFNGVRNKSPSPSGSDVEALIIVVVVYAERQVAATGNERTPSVGNDFAPVPGSVAFF